MIQKQAGAEYLTALQKLGLDPECLFWAEDEIIGIPVLVLVTRQVDRVGPLALSRLLFKAFNAAATPNEINPFLVRLHSPEQSIIQELGKVVEMNKEFELHFAHGSPVASSDRPVGPELLAGGGLRFERDWIYKWNTASEEQSKDHMVRQWRLFSENVERLAA